MSVNESSLLGDVNSDRKRTRRGVLSRFSADMCFSTVCCLSVRLIVIRLRCVLRSHSDSPWHSPQNFLKTHVL
jgi:hypothetical protein